MIGVFVSVVILMMTEFSWLIAMIISFVNAMLKL